MLIVEIMQNSIFKVSGNGRTTKENPKLFVWRNVSR